MHESSMMKNMLDVIVRVQKEKAPKSVVGITVELPEFGALTEEHFRFHFDEATKGTPWKHLNLEIIRVPFGVDAKLTHLTLRDKKKARMRSPR